ncbi:MAG: 4Fe-4S ferredoxin [Bryobacteraceae bacterium]|nr:MAG: 4Fe-4S ferredoxin [Bryobacteraceae bacterium]
MRRKSYRLDEKGLEALIARLREQGYTVYGPKADDSALHWRPIAGCADLPRGWTQELAPGRARLVPDSSSAMFHHWTCAEGLKAVLHLPIVRVLAARRDNGAFRILDNPPPAEKCAFLGVRPCDLAALAILDRVLLGDRYADDIYQARRQGAFLAAIHCQQSAPTCFCASMGSGPRARSGFDIALAEFVETDAPEYFAEAGTPAGLDMLEACGATPAPPEWARSVEEGCARAAAAQTRRVDVHAAPQLIDALFESPHWEQVARRCLACGNCTSVCPTCFCVNYEDRTSVDGLEAERWRLWDSCFTQSFTYIHGGSVRSSVKARYRQWLSHKLARWQAQFGTPGCVGCGRCIAWCPVGIDLTEEFRQLQLSAAAAASFPMKD